MCDKLNITMTDGHASNFLGQEMLADILHKKIGLLDVEKKPQAHIY